MRLLLSFGIISLFFLSCGDCEDVKIGDLPQPEYFKDYAVHEDGDVVTFEDDLGNTQVYTVSKSEVESQALGEVIGTIRGREGTTSCYEYYSVEVTTLLYFQNDGESSLRAEILNWGEGNSLDQEIKTALNINYLSNDGVNFGGAQGFYNITEERNMIEVDDPKFAKLDQWEGHGKTFENILSYFTDEGGFYFSIGQGFVGLVDYDGVLWTLKV